MAVYQLCSIPENRVITTFVDEPVSVMTKVKRRPKQYAFPFGLRRKGGCITTSDWVKRQEKMSFKKECPLMKRTWEIPPPSVREKNAHDSVVFNRVLVTDCDYSCLLEFSKESFEDQCPLVRRTR